eukprot:SAG11_NODE_1262_length_5356_cov_12.287807_4_plen_430_part_00
MPRAERDRRARRGDERLALDDRHRRAVRAHLRHLRRHALLRVRLRPDGSRFASHTARERCTACTAPRCFTRAREERGERRDERRERREERRKTRAERGETKEKREKREKRREERGEKCGSAVFFHVRERREERGERREEREERREETGVRLRGVFSRAREGRGERRARDERRETRDERREERGVRRRGVFSRAREERGESRRGEEEETRDERRETRREERGVRLRGVFSRAREQKGRRGGEERRETRDERGRREEEERGGRCTARTCSRNIRFSFPSRISPKPSGPSKRKKPTSITVFATTVRRRIGTRSCTEESHTAVRHPRAVYHSPRSNTEESHTACTDLGVHLVVLAQVQRAHELLLAEDAARAERRDLPEGRVAARSQRQILLRRGGPRIGSHGVPELAVTVSQNWQSRANLPLLLREGIVDVD